jgi:hypothetical protein
MTKIMKPESKNNQLILLLILVFSTTIYPPVINYLISSPSAYFNFLAADTFYYLTIAKNSSWINVASFDGIYSTNGFHPLWQFLLKTIFFFFNINNKINQISFAYWSSVILITVSSTILAYSLRRNNQITSTSLILLALTPGYLFFLLSVPNSNYGHIWSYMNGMESPLSLLLFSIIFFSMASNKNINAQSSNIFIGVVLSLLILTRLDDIFMLLGLLAPILWTKNNLKQKTKQVIAISLPSAIAILVYILFNKYYADSYLPISGQLKGGLSFKENLFFIINSFAPVLPIEDHAWNWWSETTWRALQMVIPPIVAISFLFYLYKHQTKNKSSVCITSLDSTLAGLGIYIILKTCYNIIFVGIWNQGHWYYPISIVSANIMLARLLSPICSRDEDGSSHILCTSKRLRFLLILGLSISLALLINHFFQETNKLSKVTLYLISIIFIACSVVFFSIGNRKFVLTIPTLLIGSIGIAMICGNSILSHKHTTGYNKIYENLFNERGVITSALLNISPNLRLLSFDDGIDAYSLGVPVMSGLGFTLDKAAFDSKKKGELLKVAYDRGFKWITSLIYMPPFDAQVGDDVSKYLLSAFWMNAQEAKNYRFTLVYRDPITNFKVISFEPVQ